MLGNLTSLEVLDLSHNDLDDLNPEAYPFHLPKNLTEFYLSGNRLQRLPDDAVHNLTKLNLLDISHNQMEIFNYTLLERVAAGLSLLINGNSLRLLFAVCGFMTAVAHFAFASVIKYHME